MLRSLWLLMRSRVMAGFVFVFVFGLTYAVADGVASSFSGSDNSVIGISSSSSVVGEKVNAPRILVLNGFGVKSLVIARILEEIERVSGKKIHQLFDVIAGSSSAGLLALALSVADPLDPNKAKYSAGDLVKILKGQSKDIFKKPSILKRVKTIGGLFGAKYSENGIKKVSQEIFGEALLSKSLTNVLVTGMDVNMMSVHSFNNMDAKTSKSDDFYVKDLAVASMATPIYFPVAKIKNLSGEKLNVVDGGLGAPNPATQAIAYAGRLGYDINKTIMTVIDGGDKVRISNSREFNNMGLFNLGADRLVKMMVSAQSSATDQALVNAFLNPDNYIKIRTNLQDDNVRLDNTSSSNLEALITAAKQTIMNNKNKINSLVKKVSNGEDIA